MQQSTNVRERYNEKFDMYSARTTALYRTCGLVKSNKSDTSVFILSKQAVVQKDLLYMKL